MNYIILVSPFLIILTVILGLICICFKKIWVGLILIVAALAYNIHIEAVPLNFSFGKERGELRVMNYNIFSSSELFQSMEKDPKELCQMIREQEPDIIVFEEYYPDHCIALRDSLLPRYPYFEFERDYCSNAIFSKYPITEWVQYIYDPEEDAVDEYKLTKAKEIDYLRYKTNHRHVATVTISLPDEDIKLIACHLSSNNFDFARFMVSDTVPAMDRAHIYINGLRGARLEREVETKHIMKEVNKSYRQGQKVIVIGDMNDVAGSRTIRDLRRGDILRNGWWEKGFGPGLTFHNHKIMHFRLDHILHTRNLKLKNIWVVEKEFSDHRPLVADFDLQH